MPVSIKRIYETAGVQHGFRILVDRLWPRGLKKETAKVDRWLKEVAPSNELRRWFNHDPAKWSEFQNKYKKELKNNAAWKELQQLAAQHKPLTLLFAAKDEKHNHAVLLAKLLNS